jgi:uncharacterized protein (TIGR02246 family)
MALTADDHIAIQQLYARYNHAIDSGKAEAWADCFTADGTFDSGQGKFSGTEQLKAFVGGFHGQMQGKARHWTNNLVLEGDGNTATGSCYLLLNRGTEPGKPPVTLIAGIYNDSLAKVDGAWRFTSRAVRPD